MIDFIRFEEYYTYISPPGWFLIRGDYLDYI
jgi:hypothetical protein